MVQVINRLAQKVGFLEADIISLQVLLEATQKENEELKARLEPTKVMRGENK